MSHRIHTSATDRLRTVQQVAAFPAAPVTTLHQSRYLHTGPAAYRVGRHLRYDPAAVRAWLAENAV